MKKVMFTILILAFATTVWAQGPFNDVPTDHWAYDAINQLQKDGILIGYPDGTFSGKRSVTRYEFAVAIARMLGGIKIPGAQPPVNLDNYVTKDMLPTIPGDLVTKDMLPDVSKFATKADLDRISRLVDSFKDELAALGVDVDALKRDVAALDARVCILENEMKRVKWTGIYNAVAFSPKNNYNGPNTIDLDNRTLQTSGLLDNISVVQDFDLSIVGRVNSATTAMATINYGSYLNYLVSVDDYVGGIRPTNKTNGLTDAFFPYYMYADSTFGSTAISVGRFPLQFTPYTLKKIDVDSYSSILKTDDGNYPVDGIQVAQSFFGVDLALYAAKHDNNAYLVNGLTGQPNSGIGPLNQAGFANAGGGNRVGGVDGLITQSAGARAKFGIPWGGNMGLTYYQAYSKTATVFDQARVFGADMSILLGERFNLVGSWTQSDTLAKAAVSDVDYLNTAWDAKIVTGMGKLGLGAGYKSISRNFAAAGSWDKIGRWDNPTNVKGPYADFTYPLQNNLKVVLNGEWLTWKDDTTAVTGRWGFKDDKILKAEAGVKWGLSSKNSLTAGYEYVQWNPEAAGADNATETYLTVGWAHEMGANAGMKVGYQFINYNGGDTGSGPYSGIPPNNYRGGLGVVQFGVSF